MIKAVLFDLDGTLIDTDGLIMASYRYLFATYRPDFSLTDEFLYSLLGPALKDVFPLYFNEDFKTLFDAYRGYNFAKHKDYVTAFPTVLETLQHLRSKGIKLAVITSKMRDAALLGMNLTEITEYFDVILGLDDVEHHKPHPEGILKAMKMMNIRPSECIYIGDSASDLIAAKRAGILMGAVDWTPKAPHYYSDKNPHLVLHQMSDLIAFVEGGN